MRTDRLSRRLRPPAAGLAASLAALALSGLCAAAPASAQASFTKAWGWGVADGASRFETCTTTCQRGIAGFGAGQFGDPLGDAVDGSGDVFVANSSRVDEFSPAGIFIKSIGGASPGHGAGQLDNAEGLAVDGSGDVFAADGLNSRIDEFSSSGAFIRAWGWGVLDGASQLETCTTTCQFGLTGGGAGELDGPDGVAVDGSGDVFVADSLNDRIDEFSSAGAFIKAWGWGVADGASQLEICTTTCQAGLRSAGAGALDTPEGVAMDRSGDVFIADTYNDRIAEFSSSGAFIKAWGWGVADGANQFESCTSTCDHGASAGGAGGFEFPAGVAVDGSGDVFVADYYNFRVDEFSAVGAFIQAWGWAVADGASHFETCTITCENNGNQQGSGAGQFDNPDGVAVDGAGNVFVTDTLNFRIEEFTAPLPQYALTVSLAGVGSGSVTSSSAGISCPGICSHTYASGTVVTLTAAPAAGSRFTGWSGAGCSGTGTCTVTMSSARAVTASFNARPSCSIRVVSAEVLLPRVKKKGKSSKRKPGTLRFDVRCDQSASVALGGTVTEVLKRKHGKNASRTFKVTTVHGRVTAHVTTTLTLKLPQAALTALAAGAHESGLFTLTATNAHGTSRATAKVARLKATGA